MAGAAGAVSARLFGANPMLTPGKARELRHLDWGVRPNERWTGAPPAVFGLRDGFADTTKWWREVAFHGS